jgi:anti-anti-sigma regulatory factor
VTLRIFAEDRDRRAVISLHGWLSRAEVGELDRVAAEAQPPVTIDLAHLVGVDTDGLRALRGHQGRGARLVGASPYVELLLEQATGRDDTSNGGAR